MTSRPNLTFMPFGAGLHRCFGAAMGYLQAQFLLPQYRDFGYKRARAGLPYTISRLTLTVSATYNLDDIPRPGESVPRPAG
jgi:cytochrome P450